MPELISESYVQRLVSEQIPESRTLDYKLEFPKNDDSAKREFLADVSAFANAGGGDIIFGVSEGKDDNGKNTGLPDKILGAETASGADGEILRLQSILRSGLDPRIPASLQIERAGDFEKGPVIVVRIPRSWAAPHMVVAGGVSRFYVRSGNMKHQMDVREIRAAFLGAGSATDRMREFMLQRLGQISADDTPVPLLRRPRLVIHLLPLASFELPAPMLDLAAASRYDQAFAGTDIGYHRPNFDGRLYYGPQQSGIDSTGYVQQFRSGAVETVETSAFAEINGKMAVSPNRLEWVIHQLCGRQLALLEGFEISAPIYAAVSMMGVRGAYLHIDHAFFARNGRSIDRDQFTIPPIMLESHSADHATLRPIFDAVWQASGFERCEHYDASGNYKA